MKVNLKAVLNEIGGSSTGGPRLTDFLTKQAECYSSALEYKIMKDANYFGAGGPQYCNTIENYERANFVKWGDITLEGDYEELGQLSTIFESYLDSIRAAIDHYFPEDNTEELRIFDHRKWIGMPSKDLRSSFNKVGTVLRVKFPSPSEKSKIATEFVRLVNKFVSEKTVVSTEHDFWCSYSSSKPVDFWSAVLRRDDLEISPTLRKMIQIAIVIPMGGAQAERSFSVMNHASRNLT